MEMISYRKDLDNLKIDSDSILIPIFNNDTEHPIRLKLLLMYVCRLVDKKEWLIVSKGHGEIISDIEEIYIPNFSGKKYVLDKKTFLYTNNELSDVTCLGTYYFLKHNRQLNIQIKDQAVKSFFTSRYKRLKNINVLVPLYSHYDTCSKIANKLLPIIDEFEVSKEFVFLNDLAIPEIKRVEEHGIYIDRSEMLLSFGTKVKELHSDNKLYSSYMFNTITGRPSNTFDKINFAALNKSDSTRKAIISRFGNKGVLLEYDYIAYHLKLIASIIGFETQSIDDLHKYMAQQYFNKVDVTGREIGEGKVISFKLLYGGITKEYEHIGFYQLLKPVVDLLWTKYTQDIYDRLPTTDREIKGINNRYKLFNYIIQNMETKRNATIIKSINDYLVNKNTKLILYTYDSFLLDYHLDDGKEVLTDLYSIVTDDNKYNVRIRAGVNYKNMKNFLVKT